MARTVREVVSEGQIPPQVQKMYNSLVTSEKGKINMSKTVRDIVGDKDVPETVKKAFEMMEKAGFSSNITPEVKKKRIESLLEDSIKEFSTQAGYALTFIPFGLGIPTLYPIINGMVEDMIDIAFTGDKDFKYKKEKFLKDVKDYIPGLVASIPALLIPGVGIAVAKTTVKNIGNDFKRAIIWYI